MKSTDIGGILVHVKFQCVSIYYFCSWLYHRNSFFTEEDLIDEVPYFTELFFADARMKTLV